MSSGGTFGILLELVAYKDIPCVDVGKIRYGATVTPYPMVDGMMMSELLVPAPKVSNLQLVSEEEIDGCKLYTYRAYIYK